MLFDLELAIYNTGYGTNGPSSGATVSAAGPALAAKGEPEISERVLPANS